MRTIINIIGIIGFLVCLFIMKKHELEFKSLDMQFRYNASTVYNTFDKIGVEGRIAYMNFLFLDFCFIISFLIVQLMITNSLIGNYTLRSIIFSFAVLRAILDILENSALLFLINKYPATNNTLANICSWFTTLKFIALYLWVIGILIFIVYNIIHKLA